MIEQEVSAFPLALSAPRIEKKEMRVHKIRNVSSALTVCAKCQPLGLTIFSQNPLRAKGLMSLHY